MNFDWKQMVGSVAPLLGGTLGGPLGAVAGKFIADALGVEEKDLPGVMSNASPDIMYKLKQLDTEFEVKMAEIGLNREQLQVQFEGQVTERHANDMKSDSWLSKNIRPVMLGITGIVIYVLSFVIILSNLSIQQAELAKAVMGLLVSLFTIMVTFYFSSRGIEKIGTIMQGVLNKGSAKKL